jgi:hypothetical protein
MAAFVNVAEAEIGNNAVATFHRMGERLGQWVDDPNDHDGKLLGWPTS